MSKRRNERTTSDKVVRLTDRYLEVIIALLLDSRFQENIAEQTSALVRLGIDNASIARILGRDPTQVSKDVYKLRGNKKGSSKVSTR